MTKGVAIARERQISAPGAKGESRKCHRSWGRPSLKLTPTVPMKNEGPHPVEGRRIGSGRRLERQPDRRGGGYQHCQYPNRLRTVQGHCARCASAAFVANMEDVLEVYQRPRDPERPVVCLDETSKQMIVETREPSPDAEAGYRRALDEADALADEATSWATQAHWKASRRSRMKAAGRAVARKGMCAAQLCPCRTSVRSKP